jgi:hypothetical protein
LTGLFDHILGLLKEKIPTVEIRYGTKNTVTPFYTASFVKDYHNLPAVAMSIVTNQQKDVGLGMMAGGPTAEMQKGMWNVTQIQVDVWARNRLESEAIGNAIMDVFQKYRGELQRIGIIDMKLYRAFDRPYDPNAPRMWFGSLQAPGEIWSKMFEYIVQWFYVWEPTYEVYDIKKIEVYEDVDGTIVSQELGVIILGLLDSMYLTRFLGDRIRLINKRR